MKQVAWESISESPFFKAQAGTQKEFKAAVEEANRNFQVPPMNSTTS